MRSRTLLAGALMSTVAAGPIAAADGGVRSVTLSSGGLAEIVRSHDVEGDAVIRLQAPAEQIDDLLKSLVVRDPAGKVGSIALDGPTQAEETFRTLPFTAADLASPVRLAGALQGVAVRVSSGGRTIEGKVLGVSDRDAGKDGGVIKILSVLTGGGAIESVAVDEGATVAVLDPEMLARISVAADVAGRARADGARAVEIRLVGEGARAVGLSYVVAAPVWKTAYRVVDGGDGSGRLQAWAILENATAEDWTDVAVTLSSGAPVTLRQRLHERLWRERPEVPVEIEGAAVPAVDRGMLLGQMAARAEPKRQRSMMAAAPAPAADGVAESREFEMAGAAETATVNEGAVAASYRLPSLVTLAAGRSLSTPIVDAEVPVERVSLFRPGAGDRPVAALLVTNATQATLPPGIVTVYEAATGYVGDARLPSTPAGEQRMASFASDRKVQVTSDGAPEQIVSDVTVVDGVARVTLTSRVRATYTIKGAPDGARAVIVEHPKRPGWSFASEALSGETPTDHRLKVALLAGETKTVTATQELVRLQTFGLADADDAAIVRWATAAADSATAGKLKRLADARAAAAAPEAEIAEIDAEAGRIRMEQDRIRQNIGAVPPQSEIARRYLRQMAVQEDQIAALLEKRDTAEARSKTLDEAVAAAIRAF